MKQFSIIMTALLVTVCGLSFASIQGLSSIDSSTTLNALSAAWKNQKVLSPGTTKNDLLMVYGGADISPRFTIVSHTTTA